MTDAERLDLRSGDLMDDKRQELLRLFPEVRTEDGKIDFDRLKLALGESVDAGKERYGLSWPGKADCFKAIRTPSLGTLRPCREESVNFDTTENLIVEGDNLEVLKLLQRSYPGKVKMIYIDPPYNTGNDFIYPDNYAESLRNYLEYTGQVDAAGRKFGTNVDSDGRFHSKWLNMMYPRLYLARNLLRSDGFIAVSIGDEELPNLRDLMNECFGEENHRNTIAVRRHDKNLSRQFVDNGLSSLAVGFEYVLIYAKSADACLNPVFREASGERQVSGYWKGFWNAPDRPTMRYPLFDCTPETGQWKWKAEVAFEAVRNYEEYLEMHSQEVTLEEYWRKTGKQKKFIRRNVNGRGMNRGVEHWIPPSTGILRTSNWTDVLASESLSYLGVPFDNPKHTQLLTALLSLGCDEQDTVLDFFAGSGTTAHAILELNKDGGDRHFILVQLPEPCAGDSEAGKAGYRTIADLTKVRVRRAIQKLDDAGAGKPQSDGLQDRGFRVFKLDESNFKPWNAHVAHEEMALAQQLEMHVDRIRDGRTPDDILYEVLLKSGFPLTTPVEIITLAGKRVYSVAGGALLVCLERALTLELIRALAELQPERVVCLDEGFAGNDQLKIKAGRVFRII